MIAASDDGHATGGLKRNLTLHISLLFFLFFLFFLFVVPWGGRYLVVSSSNLEDQA